MSSIRRAHSDSTIPDNPHKVHFHSQRNLSVRQRPEKDIVAEQIMSLNRRRAGLASRVTVCYKRLCKVDEEKRPIEEIEEAMGVLEGAFHRYRDAHIQYAELVEPVDKGKFEHCTNHFREMAELLEQARHRCEAAYYRLPVVDPVVDDDDITPSDSVSQVGSTHGSKVSKTSTNVSSMLAKLEAKKSALAVKAQLVEEQHSTKMKIKEEMGNLMLELHRRESVAIKKAQEAEIELKNRKREAEESAIQAEIEKERMELKAMTDMQKLDMEVELEAARVEAETLAKYIEGSTVSSIKVKPSSNRFTAMPHSASIHARKSLVDNASHTSNVRLESTQYQSKLPSYQLLTPETNMFSPDYKATKSSSSRHHPTKEPEKYITSQQRDPSVISDQMSQQSDCSSEHAGHIFAQRQLFDAIRLPKTKIAEFDGNPLRFAAFMSSFDSFVDKSTVGDADKLTCLMEYCVGKAAKVIEPCALMESASGYQKARELLKKRFGDPYTISHAWVHKIVNGPPVKPNDSEALRDFADDIRGCLETLRAIDRLNDVDSQERMVKVMSRLPVYLQSRWRKKAYQTRKDKVRYPNFEECVEFLEMVAEEACDPVFGKLEIQTKGKTDKSCKPATKGRGTSFNVQATDAKSTKEEEGSSKPRPKPRCHICSKEHSVIDCDQFKKMTPEKRVEAVRKKRLCFGCLDYSNHVSSRCRRASVCPVKDCSKKHSVLLHDALVSVPKDEAQSTEEPIRSEGETTEHVQAQSCACGQSINDELTSNVALPTVSVYVRGRGQSQFIKTQALLDTGSNRTFCSMALADQLQLRGQDTTLSLETLGDDKAIAAVEVQLEVTATTGRQQTRKIVNLPRVFAMRSFPTLTRNVVKSDIAKWSHLQNLKLPKDDLDNVSILIGQDVPTALVPLEVRSGRLDEPYAVRTVLGWTVNGPVAKSTDKSVISNFIHVGLKNSDDRLEAQVQQFWKLDSGPAMTRCKTHPSQEDKRVIQKWNESICLKDGHYQLDIPFRDTTPKLPNNHKLAERRLQSLGRRLTKDPVLHQKYKDGIQELIDKGYAERVPPDQVQYPQGTEWYLPHHNVVHPAKPDKFRIVFDCAAEYAGTSLNKEVLQGPDLTNNLIGVLLRFRENPVAIMGDIEGMFHQVKVSSKHRDALRFLWWKDGEVGGDQEVFRMTVHLFGGVWSPSCASFALRRTAEDYLHDFPPEVIDTVNRDFYVDDCLRSLESDDKAVQMIGNLSELLYKGGFRLTKWSSNSKNVIRSVPLEDRAKEVKSLDLDSETLPVERALGIHWDTESDMFGIKIREKVPVFTRRGLLRITSSVYDPLGFVSPYVLQAKKVFQDECKQGKGWDDDIDPANRHKWEVWLKGLPELQRFKVPRCLLPDDFGKVICAQLHHFGDASEDAYGTASYLRLENDEQKVHCALVMAKSRLAPIHQVTIPRLELCAAVTAVKIDSLLRSELRMSLQESVFWTDSTTVLHYIWSKTKRFQTFVANRLAMIHESTNQSQWRYVSSKDNPADDSSRGLNAETMLDKKRWREGPDFLWKDHSEWPSMPIHCPSMLDNDNEVRKETKSYATVAEVEGPVDRLLNHYSDWFRLRKAVAWFLRFGQWLQHGKPKLERFLSVKEVQRAEKCIFKYMQQQKYTTEIQSLKLGNRVSKKSRIYSLEPWYDDGLLKIGGRLDKAPIADAAKHPTIVPRDHHVTKLLVRHVHEWESHHRGREYVMSILRQKYWIPCVRPLVKRILQDCVICKRLRGKLQDQKMSILPIDRVTPQYAPFTYTGVDCFGPFLVKRGRSQEKRYGCLFTCLTMRAIHIEKLHTMDGDSFINALIRFIARRGKPKKIRSDNGSNFVGGNRELRESIQKWNDSHETRQELLIRQIEWEFNPPTASHMGGVWERQIRTVRSILSSILRNQVLDDERLDTIFAEVENIVNSRPLTPVSDDSKDSHALTPNDLLRPGAGFLSPPGIFGSRDAYGRRWRHVQFVINEFWRRWVREYLPTLINRAKWITKKRNIQVGDVVMLLDESQHRMHWPLARVQKVFHGKDGAVRSVEVKTAYAESVCRPVAKICLLEASREET